MKKKTMGFRTGRASQLSAGKSIKQRVAHPPASESTTKRVTQSPASKPIWELSGRELSAAGRAAGRAAVADSKARGLPVTGVEGAAVVQRSAGGGKKVVKTLRTGRPGPARSRPTEAEIER